LFDLKLPLTLPHSILPSGAIISCILLGKWRAHWNVVFEETPFVPDLIVPSIRTLLNTFQKELLLSMSALPPPDVFTSHNIQNNPLA
ncbi:hypothetical protein BDB01DRAFT_808884, partial [Pilobolus umbonatus]